MTQVRTAAPSTPGSPTPSTLPWTGPIDVPTPSTDPLRRAVMVQRWTDLVFVHWRYPADVVQALLPDGLTVDTFDGDAFVGLIPFQMEGLGLPGLAPLPHVGAFPEVNVRTYVRGGGRRGVWFFSLDVDRYAPALAARAGYRLPYCAGAVEHRRIENRIRTRVDRSWPRARGENHATTVLGATITDTALDDPLVHFLTDRWRLFSPRHLPRRGGRGLRSAEVEHDPWSIRHAELETLDDTLVIASGLPAPAGDPHVCWSPGVDVRIGRPKNIRAS